jgi:clan AA aspartic protease (TIGR02281 family)
MRWLGSGDPRGHQSGTGLTADGNGHFLTTGNINGTTVRFLVDTGATMISLGAGDARRIGIDASKGQPGIPVRPMARPW